MLSSRNRAVVYPISADITEHDLNIVSDLWKVEGREVFRGARDPEYEHANVYWLYDPDDLDRIGVAEHDRNNPGDVSVLWYKDTPFATLLQEDGWTESDSIWSRMSEHAYEQFLTEGWTSPMKFLERCVRRGSVRIVTPEMIAKRPEVYSCEKCGHTSLSSFPCGTPAPLTFPEKEKVWFIDERMMVFIPPAKSSVWSLLGFTISEPEPFDQASLELQQQPELELEEVLPSEQALPQLQHPLPLSL